MDNTSSVCTSTEYSNNYSYEDYNPENYQPCKYERHSAIFLPMFYSLLFVVGGISNGLVLCVMLILGKLQNMTDICLLNLAVADLLLLSALPFLAHYSRADWVFGAGMCKVVLSTYYVGFNSCIFFIVIMSIDRYLTVVHAVYALKTRTRTYRVIFIGVTWTLGLLASFPEILLIDVHSQNNTVLCEAGYNSDSFWKVFSLLKMNAVGLLIPFCIMLFCYSMIMRRILRCKSTKRKTIHLVLLVVVVFFCCWTPYNVASFFKALELLHIYTACESSKAIQLSLQITEAVAYCHTCLNPIIYVFVGEKFRRNLFKLINRWFCVRYRLTVHTHTSELSMSSKGERPNTSVHVTSVV